ncbi:transferase [Nostoc sp. CENA67]|uniref:Transferase n=1 Tax=Amazonocrinis nigriterrae CENA67 TaxID=2794033 RepID=A0A8J7HNN4_9NOST|nr:transferase [Amazonocrinis nigriterrae]MBH8562762.1 transferase [Amazonocrinis nigriterrae CENA67]
MSVPPLRLLNSFEPYISGDVTIDPSAVLAPGVILQAAANSKIIIGPGVCIGMGSILQVTEGTLEVAAGANLGAGFLMVGKGKIGENACIGSATTLFNCSVEPGVVVPAGSILGDTSRQIYQQKQLEPSKNDAATTSQKQSQQDKVISSTSLSASAFLEFKHQSVSPAESSPTAQSQSAVQENTNGTNSNLESATEESTQSSPPTTESSNNSFGTQIYGQGSIQRLLGTLFPHRQALNQPISDDQSE